MDKEEMKAIARLVREGLAWSACPHCGAIEMLCAQYNGSHTVCSGTMKAIKRMDVSWDEWLTDERGPDPLSPAKLSRGKGCV